MHYFPHVKQTFKNSKKAAEEAAYAKGLESFRAALKAAAVVAVSQERAAQLSRAAQVLRFPTFF